jgi:AraC-like DNA-binding protein
VLSERTLVAGPHVTAAVVTCSGGPAGWTEPELGPRLALVLPVRGVFRLRSAVGEVVVEPSTGYLRVPDTELAFAHPAGGDVCTLIAADEWLWPVEPVGGAPVRIGGEVELAHRRLVRAIAGGDQAFAVPESLVRLLGVALTRAGPAGGGRLAADAAEAIAVDAPAAAGLVPLARWLGASPAHLSRTFQRHTGVTLTRYRNRVRVSRALDRLLDGERDLAALAAELGFADQAHLTRVVRAAVGQPPGAVRAVGEVT